MMKKRYVTLIELLVALALASIMFSMLFGYYYQLKKMELKLEYKREDIQEWRSFQARLSNIFLRLKTQKGNIQNKEHSEHLFFTERDTNNLVFTYNNGSSLNPVFSNTVLAKLYIDEEGTLSLIRWPWKKEGYDADGIATLQFEKETFLRGLDRVVYKFYDRGKKEWIKEIPISMEVKAPDFIRVFLYFKEDALKPLELSFHIRNAGSHKVLHPVEEAS